MRKIKFRIWDKESNTLFSDDEAYLIGLNGNIFDWNGNDLGKEFVIQQFTGLLDKNGKEIYEGDIVKSGYENKYGKFYYNYIVSYNQKTCVFEGLMNLKQKTVGIRMTHNNKSIEVIGNIFENKELLNKVKN